MSKFKNCFSIIIATTLLSTPLVTFAQETNTVSTESNVTSVEDVLVKLKEKLVTETPLTKEQIKLVPADFWDSLSDSEMNDFKALWEKMMDTYPEIFKTSIQSLRDKMKTDFQFTDQELDFFTDKSLMWTEFQMRKANNNQTDLQKLADEIKTYITANMTTASEVTEVSEESIASEELSLAEVEEGSLVEDSSDPVSEEMTSSEEVVEATASEVTEPEATVSEELVNSAMRQATPDTTTAPEVAQDTSSNQTMMSANQQATNPAKISDIRKIMIDITPITPKEFDQISENQWLAIVNEVEAGGGDPSGTFNVAMERYPSVFQAETEWLYSTLVTQEHFDNALLRQTVSPNELRWFDYLTLNKQAETDFPALAAKITAAKGLSNDVLGDDLKRALMESTPITEAQYKAITPEQWSEIESAILSSGYGDIATLYNRAVEKYPSVFEKDYQDLRKILVEQYGVDGQVLDNAIYRPNVFWAAYMSRDKFGDVRYNLMLDELQKQANLFPGTIEETTIDRGKAIEHVKNVLIAKTPMTAAQFSLLPAKDVLNIANAVDTEYVVIYNNFLADNPEVFKPEITMIRGELEKLGINPQSLTKVSDQTLLWYEFEAFVANGNQPNYKGLADRLVKEGLASWNVQVTKTKSNLPNTGETANKFVPFIGVGLIAIAAIVLLRKKNTNIDKH